MISLRHPSGARAEVVEHGAQVMSFVDASGRERLYRGASGTVASDGWIRGGVPVVFPQFADRGPLPMHGFAGTRDWSVVAVGESSATLQLSDDEATRRLWSHAFRAELDVRLSTELSVALTVWNTGESPFDFTAALHTYFAVDDVHQSQIAGLSRCNYRDKLRGFAEFVDVDPAIVIGAHTDRVYEQAPATVRVNDLVLVTSGFGDWVVWNPWDEMTRRLSDMRPDDYLRMVCVEAARIARPVELRPREAWTGTQVMRVKP